MNQNANPFTLIVMQPFPDRAIKGKSL